MLDPISSLILLLLNIYWWVVIASVVVSWLIAFNVINLLNNIVRSLVRLLDAMTGAPAFVRNDRLDIMASNRLGRALYSQHFLDPRRPANTARFLFLDPSAQTFYPDWEQVASAAVGRFAQKTFDGFGCREVMADSRVTTIDKLKARWETARQEARPDRRAFDPERVVPHALGHPQRPHPRHRHQALPSSRRRRPEADLRDDGSPGRFRLDHIRLHRGARLEVRAGPESLGELGGDARSGGRDGERDRRGLIRGSYLTLLLFASPLENRALEPGGFEPPTFWLPARRSPN